LLSTAINRPVLHSSTHEYVPTKRLRDESEVLCL